MSELLQCPSCGGSNQLPEGRNSMFCSFCGNVIEKKQSENASKEENLIKSKPQIIDNCLTLKNRKINSLVEILSWFSDDELKELNELDLRWNNISSLEGIESFRGLEKLDLRDNKFIELSQSDIDRINGIYIGKNSRGFSLDLYNNQIASDSWVSKINVTKILNTYTGKFYLDSNYNHKYHTNYDLVCLYIGTNNGKINEFHPKSSFRPKNKSKNSEQESKEGSCFIATATMGSYGHPQVMELRHFRDEWILEKSWGESFVNWYYKYGEIAAKFIEKSFVLKKVSYLLIVKPLVCLSRIVK